MRAGNHHWLVVDGERETLWRLLSRFWDQVGIPLRLENQGQGMMETIWFEGREHRYLSPTRDKVRLRLENSEEGEAVEIYLTHYGAIKDDDDWRQRERDLDIELELFRRLAGYLGHNIESATIADQKRKDYRIDADSLTIPERFDRAWRLSGIALERIGLVISDRDRSKGLYYISQSSYDNIMNDDTSSWFTRKDEPAAEATAVEADDSGEEKSEEPTVEIAISSRGHQSQLTIKSPLSGEEISKLLLQLQEQLLK